MLHLTKVVFKGILEPSFNVVPCSLVKLQVPKLVLRPTFAEQVTDKACIFTLYSGSFLLKGGLIS